MFGIRKNGNSLLTRILLAAAMLVAGNSAMAATFLYTGGHDLDGGRLAALGHTSTTFTPDDAGWANAIGGGLGAFDGIIIGEGQSCGGCLSGPTKALIVQYVVQGGRVIIVGDHNASLDVLNDIFGFSASVWYGCYEGDLGGTLQASAAAGTTYADGPASLNNEDCGSAVTTASLPTSTKNLYTTSIYGPETTVAFATQYGAGTLLWLGWDFCCASSSASEDDWYSVLDASARYDFHPANLRVSFSGPGTQFRAGTVVPVYARIDNYGRSIANHPIVDLVVDTSAVTATPPAGWTCADTSVSIPTLLPGPGQAGFRCTPDSGSMALGSVLIKLNVTAPSSTPSGFVTVNGEVSANNTDPVPGNNSASFKVYVRPSAAAKPYTPPVN